jgi:hypothetical protein
VNKYRLVLNNKEQISMPVATETTYGAIKVGDGLIINNGRLSVNVNDPLINIQIAKNGVLVPQINGVVNIQINKQDVGLDLVDNTADIDKPISTATRLALDGKVDKITGKQLSTNDYTNADKIKVNNIGKLLRTVQEIPTDMRTNDYIFLTIGE